MAYLFCKCSLKPILITQSEDYCFGSFLLTPHLYTTNSVTTVISYKLQRNYVRKAKTGVLRKSKNLHSRRLKVSLGARILQSSTRKNDKFLWQRLTILTFVLGFQVNQPTSRSIPQDKTEFWCSGQSQKVSSIICFCRCCSNITVAICCLAGKESLTEHETRVTHCRYTYK